MNSEIKRKRKWQYVIAIFSLEVLTSLVFFSRCKEPKMLSGTDLTTASPLITLEKDGIRLTEVVSPSFNTATLVQKAPTNLTWCDTVVGFNFSVADYSLGIATSDAGEKLCSNSPEGQHIHHILNNEPYTAHYVSNFTKTLKDGHYISLSFLSRSYHESVKTRNAYQLTQFSVGAAKMDIKPYDLNKPMLFYSRPKGAYKGADTKYVLLDFYVVNCNLSEKEYKVRARINGVDFIIEQWTPFFIEGLKEGDNTIELTLLDKNNAIVVAPFNPMKRTIQLSNMVKY